MSNLTRLIGGIEDSSLSTATCCFTLWRGTNWLDALNAGRLAALRCGAAGDAGRGRAGGDLPGVEVGEDGSRREAEEREM
jgi:hypothetical protein